jgi:hypothetical protein
VPVINRIVRTPVFASDGALTTEPGYHANGTFYDPPTGFAVAPIPHRPNPQEVDEARCLLLDDLLVDFPFVGEADRAHAMAMLMLPFVRSMVDGPTPFHQIEAPAAGTGKTLLAEVIAIVVLGALPPAETQANNGEEWRKKISAMLSTGQAVVFLDNLSGRLDSPHLAAVFTSDVWADRRLGKNDEVLRYPNRATWIGTANNLTLSRELVRRTLPIRLDAGIERPEDRDPATFEHHPLRTWVRTHRAELVAAVLTLVQAWIVEDRPAGQKNMATFEEWASVVGGILQVAGIDGFLTNLEEFRDRADTETDWWTAFIVTWSETHHDQPVAASTLLDLLDDLPDFMELGAGSYRSRLTSLGLRLKEKENAVIAGHRITQARDRQGSHRWKLSPIDETG